MNEPENDREAQFGLVMPFVTVASKGGPHDDNSYVAGYEMGKLDVQLAKGDPFYEITIRTVSVPQADLMAMRYGYAIKAESGDEWPEWTYVQFTKEKNDL